MFKTIFKRLFWTSTAIIVLVVSLISMSMIVLMDKFVLEERMTSAKKASQSIEYLTTEIAMDGFDSRLKMVYNSTLASWSMMLESSITVIDENGGVFASTNNNDSAIPNSFLEEVLSGKTISKSLSSKKNDRPGYLIGFPISYQGKVIGGIFYLYPPGLRSGTIKAFSHTVFISLLIALFIALCLVYLESLQISRPLKKINSATLEIASGKFDKRVNVSGKDEIAQLASSFNYMTDSLERLEEMRAGFVSDISHELRTPMTSISGFVAGILDGTIPKEKQNDYLELVLEETTRLSRLTNEMFEMTKITSKGYKLSITKFDLAETVRLSIIGLGQKIDKKNIDLDVNFEENVMNVLADQDAIKRVIINLLDNAIKFGFENSLISISVFNKDKSTVFEISNIGNGISEEDIPYIFDRFYKSDKSRSRNIGGVGLGLSFVKNILNLHSQQITAKSVPINEKEKRTTFSFTLQKA